MAQVRLSDADLRQAKGSLDAVEAMLATDADRAVFCFLEEAHRCRYASTKKEDIFLLPLMLADMLEDYVFHMGDLPLSERDGSLLQPRGVGRTAFQESRRRARTASLAALSTEGKYG